MPKIVHFMPRNAAMPLSPFGPPRTKRHVDRWQRFQRMFHRLEGAKPGVAEGFLIVCEKFLAFHGIQTDDQKGGA